MWYKSLKWGNYEFNDFECRRSSSEVYRGFGYAGRERTGVFETLLEIEEGTFYHAILHFTEIACVTYYSIHFNDRLLQALWEK